MCVTACRLMMVACLEHVINVEVIQNKSQDILIEAPGDQVKELKSLSKTCRDTAADAKAKFEESKGEVKESAEAVGEKAAAAVGGALGSLGMGAAMAAANAAKSVAEAAGGAAAAVTGATGSAIAAGFTLVADGLDGAIAPVEKDFSQVAQQLVESKKTEIFTIYNKVITECIFENATNLIRGKAPYGAAEYAATNPGSVATGFNGACADKLAAELLPQVGEFVKTSQAVKAWSSAIDQYNAANAQLGSNENTKSLQQKPIELDIEAYIVKATIGRLKDMMAKHEALCRKEPKDKVKQRMQTFETCFSGDDITIHAYQEFETGK